MRGKKKMMKTSILCMKSDYSCPFLDSKSKITVSCKCKAPYPPKLKPFSMFNSRSTLLWTQITLSLFLSKGCLRYFLPSFTWLIEAIVAADGRKEVVGFWLA